MRVHLNRAGTSTRAAPQLLRETPLKIVAVLDREAVQEDLETFVREAIEKLQADRQRLEPPVAGDTRVDAEVISARARTPGSLPVGEPA